DQHACKQAVRLMPNDTDEEMAQFLATADGFCTAGHLWACRDLANHHRHKDKLQYVRYLIRALRLGDTDVHYDLWYAVQSRPVAEVEYVGALVCAWGAGHQCHEFVEEHLTKRPALARLALTYGCEDGDTDSCRTLRRMN
ncbi:MAG: hypothetical protein AAGH17_04240, partial [Pseudomonadota bacterium]